MAAIEKQGLLQYSTADQIMGFAHNKVLIVGGKHLVQVDFVHTPGSKPSPSANNQNTFSDGQKVPPLQRVVYDELWPGIRLTYESTHRGIAESSWELRPGSDPQDILLHYNAPVDIDVDGSLRIRYETGWMRVSSPVAWQEIKGRRIPVKVAFTKKSSSPVKKEKKELIGFRLGAYNHSYPLTIDPILEWNTFLGAAGQDYGKGIALDRAGFVYVVGGSEENWGSPVHAHSAGGYWQGFIAKLKVSDGSLVWNTFMEGGDAPSSIAVDRSGGVYVAGTAYKTWGTPVSPFTGCQVAFVLKLTPADGTPLWHTFLGRNDMLDTRSDFGLDIAVDSAGGVYMAGKSYETWDSSATAVNQAIAVKLKASDGTLVWSTFLGGTESVAYGITVDGTGGIYVCGLSSQSWGTPKRSFSGPQDAFAARLNDTTGALEWNTFLGTTSSYDSGAGIVAGSGGKVYVTGSSWGTWGSPVNAHAGGTGTDIYAASLKATDGSLVWNTFLGGTYDDSGNRLTVDDSGNLYLIGSTYNPAWGNPVGGLRGEVDAVVIKLNAASGALAWNYYLGGNDYDFGNDVAVDDAGNVFAVGDTLYYQWGTPVRIYSGDDDAFVARINDQPIGIYGSKWNDQIPDGEWGPGEPGLGNWTIELYDNTGATLITSTTTDANGAYGFESVGGVPLDAGYYVVKEVKQQGWTQTYPLGDGTHYVYYDGSHPTKNINFGNTDQKLPAPGIHGFKWNDLNGNGQWDKAANPAEKGIPGWEIKLLDFELKTVVATTRTDQSGAYSFTKLDDGSPLGENVYEVTETQQPGWKQTARTGPPIVNYLPGKIVTGINFGNRKFGISGFKWNDVNGNGVWDNVIDVGKEPPLANWQITLRDSTGKNILATTKTDARGAYIFYQTKDGTPLATGTYIVSETPQSGWTQTFPSGNGTHSVTYRQAELVENINFGNHNTPPPTAEISGFEWNDLNGNATWDRVIDVNWEPPLQLWEITLLDGSGKRVNSVYTDGTGAYSFSLTEKGQPLPAGKYTVRETLQSGWRQTFPTGKVHQISYDGIHSIRGLNFGNINEKKHIALPWLMFLLQSDQRRRPTTRWVLP